MEPFDHHRHEDNEHNFPFNVSQFYPTTTTTSEISSQQQQELAQVQTPSLVCGGVAPGIDHWASLLLQGAGGNIGPPLQLQTDAGEGNSSLSGSGGKEKGIKVGGRGKKVTRPRFAFQTRSANDILDDGYRWRKYGQKAVKNSAYPR